jgi:hypothetical protein
MGLFYGKVIIYGLRGCIEMLGCVFYELLLEGVQPGLLETDKIWGEF